MQKKDPSARTSSDEKRPEQSPFARVASEMGWSDEKEFWAERKNLIFGQIRPIRKKKEDK